MSHSLPERFVFRSPSRQPYSDRFAGLLRMGVCTAVPVALGPIREATGSSPMAYVLLLWFVPFGTMFMYFYFMLLRDTYQHTNAGHGRLTNTCVFFCDPMTRWAVFVYGQDMHVPHHLFPTVPHDRLGRLLKSADEDYARQVVECRGTFANDGGSPTILDVPTGPPAGEPDLTSRADSRSEGTS